MTHEVTIVPKPEYRVVYAGKVLGIYTKARDVLRSLPAEYAAQGFRVVCALMIDGEYTGEAWQVLP